MDAVINSLLKFILLAFALCIPSTKTLRVPSGSFKSCIILATVPKEYKFSLLGLSTFEFF